MSQGSRSTLGDGERLIEPSTLPNDIPAVSGGANGLGLYDPSELKPLVDPRFVSPRYRDLKDGRSLGWKSLYDGVLSGSAGHADETDPSAAANDSVSGLCEEIEGVSE